MKEEVLDARAEASRILAEARAQAEEIRERARQEGRADGKAEVAALLAKARRVTDRRIADADKAVVALAVHIAERIVRRQLAVDPDTIADIAKGALEEARGRHDFVMRVHPDDVARLERERPGLLARLSVSAHIVIRADDAIAPGGCVIDSEVGTVDARLETQLAAIQRALEESL